MAMPHVVDGIFCIKCLDIAINMLDALMNSKVQVTILSESNLEQPWIEMRIKISFKKRFRVFKKAIIAKRMQKRMQKMRSMISFG